MFIKTAGEPTKTKKAVYLTASTILGIMLSAITHGIIEIIYLNLAQSQGKVVAFYNGCALHPVLQVAIWLVGVLGGFYVGRVWWKKVYIERV